MFHLKPTAAETTTTIRLAVPQSLHDQLTAAAAEANIEVQEAARQAIAYAVSRMTRNSSSRTTTARNSQATPPPKGNTPPLDAEPGSPHDAQRN
jgi:hypothetical protein